MCAGVAYAGYTVVANIRRNKPKKKSTIFSQTHSLKLTCSQSTQTDLSSFNKPISEESFASPKSVRERISDLNQSERLRKRSIPVSPEVKPLGFHGSPWSSPLGCAKFLSVSAENISSRPASAPEYRCGGHMVASQSTLDVELQAKLSRIQVSDKLTEQMMPVQEEAITMKSLSNLQKTPSKMTLFEVRNLVRLLHSANEDVLVKTLVTISNCAAFTTNQELLCESECPKLLKELLLTQSKAVKVGVTQAISNISTIERSHRYFQTHIPILLNNAINSRELLKSLSLTALANLALDPASHKMMIKHVKPIASMAKNGTTVVQLQSLRLLVNLSCNNNVIPTLLMSEVPNDFLDMILKPCDREVQLRLLTFLSNVSTFATQFVNSSSKATLLSVLYNFTKRTKLTELISLSSDQDEDISMQAKRLYKALSGVS